MTIEEMKARKKELGLSNEKIAQLSTVPIGTVQKIFSGETSAPRYNTIRKLEAVLMNAHTNIEYEHIEGEPCRVAESLAVKMNYFDAENSSDSYNNMISASRYIPGLVNNRIGIAAGKFKVPDDSYFYDDEIADMFEEL